MERTLRQVHIGRTQCSIAISGAFWGAFLWRREYAIQVLDAMLIFLADWQRYTCLSGGSISYAPI